MSYDIFIFRPKAGVSREWINEFLESDAANDENADPEEVDENYIDINIDRDELSSLVAVPLIRALCNQEFSQEEIDAYLEDPDYGTDLSDCMDTALEYHDGYKIMVAIGYGGQERGLDNRLWDCFEELHDRGLMVYDPQVGGVLDMKDDHETFLETFRESYDADESDFSGGFDEDDEDY